MAGLLCSGPQFFRKCSWKCGGIILPALHSHPKVCSPTFRCLLAWSHHTLALYRKELPENTWKWNSYQVWCQLLKSSGRQFLLGSTFGCVPHWSTQNRTAWECRQLNSRETHSGFCQENAGSLGFEGQLQGVFKENLVERYSQHLPGSPQFYSFTFWCSLARSLSTSPLVRN